MTQGDRAFSHSLLDADRGKAIDVYEGWVATKVNKYWYRARIAPGFVSLVDFTTPNAHTTIVRKSDLDMVLRGERVPALPFALSPYVMLGAQIYDLSDYNLATVRYGRVDTIGEKPGWLIDGFSPEADHARSICGDLSAELPLTS